MSESTDEPIEVLPGQASIFDAIEEATEQQEVVVEESEWPWEGLTTDDGQLSFVDPDGWWKELWRGMPEFVQDDLEPWKSIQVHFASREDMNDFATLIGQRLTGDTRSVWFPQAEIGRMVDKVFIDESEA